MFYAGPLAVCPRMFNRCAMFSDLNYVDALRGLAQAIRFSSPRACWPKAVDRAMQDVENKTSRGFLWTLRRLSFRPA